MIRDPTAHAAGRARRPRRMICATGRRAVSESSYAAELRPVTAAGPHWTGRATAACLFTRRALDGRPLLPPPVR